MAAKSMAAKLGKPPKSSRKSEKLPPPSQRTLAQSWIAIPARTRLYISLGLCIAGGTGLIISNFLETSMPLQPKDPAQSVDH